MQTKDVTIELLYNIFLNHAELINPFGATIQCIHESTSGGKPLGSGLAIQANNLTGIKAGSSWKGKTIDKKTWEQRSDGTTYQTVAKFRAWDTLEDFCIDYSKMVNSSYSNCTKDNFIGYFSGFSKGKYGAWATDLNYFKKLLTIAWRYSNLFFETPLEKWKAVVVNACDRDLFILPQHEEMAIKFLKDL